MDKLQWDNLWEKLDHLVEQDANLPDTLPREFVEDAFAHARMLEGDGPTTAVYGVNHQLYMLDKWPEEWMSWLFNEIGWFDSSELREYDTYDESLLF